MRRPEHQGNGLRISPILLATALAAALGLCQCGADGAAPTCQTAAFDFEPYLPDPARLDGWRPDRDPRVYEGDDLYAFINGGADIYHEYGFERVIVQDYTRGSGKITLEVYEMARPEAAFGIWSLKKGSGGRPLQLSGSGMLIDYYAHVWKGPFLFTLTAIDQSADTIAGLEVIAGAVDAMIESDAEEPHIVNLLRVDGLLEQSVVFMTGPIALLNCQRFFPRDVFRADEAVKGDYENGCRVFVFAYEGEEQAEERFGQVYAAFRGSADYGNQTLGDHLFRTVSKKGRVIEVRLAERFLLLVLADKVDGEAAALRMGLEKRIATFF